MAGRTTLDDFRNCLRITTATSNTTATSAARPETAGTTALEEPPVLASVKEPHGEHLCVSVALPGQGSPWQPMQTRARVLLQPTEHAENRPHDAHARALPALQTSTIEAWPSQTGPKQPRQLRTRVTLASPQVDGHATVDQLDQVRRPLVHTTVSEALPSQLPWQPRQLRVRVCVPSPQATEHGDVVHDDHARGAPAWHVSFIVAGPSHSGPQQPRHCRVLVTLASPQVAGHATVDQLDQVRRPLVHTTVSEALPSQLP
jgi:hypothetical protein